MNLIIKKNISAKKTTVNQGSTLNEPLPCSAKELRIRLGLTQGAFWTPVGVSQSGGSRYESGRKLPASISALIRLIHIEGIDLASLKGEHALVGKYLSDQEPDRYGQLLKSALASIS